MELEKELIKKTVIKLLDDENITFMSIDFKVGLEGTEVNAKANALGTVLLETLGVSSDELNHLINEIIRPATTEFNKKLSNLISDKQEKKVAETKVE